ncbi:MAG: hypothetical protein K1X38_00570 [Microthrixaceae bacterium]|nr:hypothetical protein [Microthrixaceae bacterium]
MSTTAPPHAAPPPPRALRGRAVAASVALPTGRAIVGGLLVASSALGLFAAHRAATTPDETAWVVLRRAVAAGERISAEDLGLAPMSLAETTRTRAVADPGDVIGDIALVPLHEGDLVLRSATADSPPPTGTGRRIGLALDAAAALGGDVATGDRVDIVALPDGDIDSEVVVRGALITSVGIGDSAGVGATDQVQLNIDVPDEEAARRVIDAHGRGGVTLISTSTVTLDEPAADA